MAKTKAKMQLASVLGEKTRARKRNLPLTREEVSKTIATTTDLMEKTLLIIGFNSGMRISEVMGLSRLSIDQVNREVMIWDEKKDRYRRVTIPENTIHAIQLYLNASKLKGDMLFPVSLKTAERIINRRIKQATGKDRSWHCVRHTYVSISSLLHTPIDIVAENTGDSVATLMRHPHNHFHRLRSKQM